MNVEDLKRKTEADISEFITKKIIELKKRQEKKFPISSLMLVKK
ncbi:GnsA/GnsB family [Citrobacter youngae]|nr:GnsA/GnsB family [Citrobacter youngae]